MPSKTKVQPLADRLIVLADKAEEVTSGGIIIPDNAKEATQSGKVIEVGEGCQEVERGQKVLYGKYAGSEIVIDNVTHLILKEEEILCVLE